MRTSVGLGATALLLSTTGIIAAPSAVEATTTVETFGYTGSSVEWVVPAGVTQVTVEASGARGGDSATALESGPVVGGGGLGGTTTATLAVSPGEVLTVVVGGRGGDGIVTRDLPDRLSALGGGGGYNGGGCAEAFVGASDGSDSPAGWTLDRSPCGETAEVPVGPATAFATAVAGGGGGGASTVSKGGTTFVAAAGGGGGGAFMRQVELVSGEVAEAEGTAGGGGGGATGAGGQSYAGSPLPATTGGTQGAGGSDGAAAGTGGAGLANGNSGPTFANGFAGGGGGGGWFGGGGLRTHSSGAGGSSFPIEETATGARDGDGAVSITAEIPDPDPGLDPDGPSEPGAETGALPDVARPSAAPVATPIAGQPKVTG